MKDVAQKARGDLGRAVRAVWVSPQARDLAPERGSFSQEVSSRAAAAV